MSLQFTHVPFFACRGGYKSRERIVLLLVFYYVTITWQQISKVSLYMLVAGVLLHETVECRHFGR